jgi:FkbM family methyltransferase
MKEKDYSQHGEQKVLERWFKTHRPRNRFLVDVGAYAVEISNTFYFLKQGWEGLLIEPSPMRYRGLVEAVKGLKARVIKCGAGEGAARLPLYLHAVGGHDSFLKDWGHSEIIGEAPLVNVYPLTEILRDWGAPGEFDLLSIDTEGMDFRIMKKFFEDGSYKPSVIVTEVESYKDVEGFFKGVGYRLLTHLGDPVYGNSIFVTMGKRGPIVN